MPCTSASGARRPAAAHAQAQARRRTRIAAGLGSRVGEEQEAALGPRDAHDRVQHLLQHLAQDEGGVQGLDQGEQELLLLDPGELRDLLGRARPTRAARTSG